MDAGFRERNPFIASLGAQAGCPAPASLYEISNTKPMKDPVKDDSSDRDRRVTRAVAEILPPSYHGSRNPLQ